MFTWLECAMWLDKCNVLPNNLKEKLDIDCLNINEFSNGLRDGLILCDLLNRISSINHSNEINWRAKGRVACLKNIRIFLENCKKEFYLTDEDLFQPDMLYDLNMECIFHALSKISKIESVEKKCEHIGFNVNQTEQPDIYENIQVEVQDESYTEVDAIVCDLDAMYENIMNIKLTKEEEILNIGIQGKHNTRLSGKDNTIKEIFESETKFVNTLMIFHKDFMIHLMPILNDSDKKIVFLNIESIKDLHVELLKKLREALEGNEGRSNRICNAFDSFVFKMMREYVDYVAGINKELMFKIDTLLSSNKEFKVKLEWCNSQSSMGIFKLYDLIRLPFQRVLKYHLLFSNLDKYTQNDHPSKKNIQKSLSNILDLSNYLNESKSQSEKLNQMNLLNSDLQGFNFKTTTLADFGRLINNDKIQIKEESTEAFAKTRTILLLNKVLFICKSRGDKLVYKGTMMLNDFQVEDKKVNANQLNLVSIDHMKVYSLYFKDVKQKNEWKNDLKVAIDELQPKGFSNKNHRFILYNFKREIVYCSICKSLLLGIFYQGYKCINCGCISHKNCIAKLDKECMNGSKDLNLMPNQSPVIEPERRATQFVSYKCKALYTYQGRPMPVNKKYLTFIVGDIIQVTDDDCDDWWKGYKLTESNYEGYFPSNKVQEIKNDEPVVEPILRKLDSETASEQKIKEISVIKYEPSVILRKQDSETENKQSQGSKQGSSLTQISFTNQPWFSHCDARTSLRVLSNAKNSLGQTIFLVRPSQEGGYTITIKHKSQINHLRILSTSSNKFTLDKNLEFSSVQVLVDYYMTHKLDFFPQLDTTLGIPYTNTLINLDMENETWYSNQKHEIATKILNGLEEKDKPLFLVRPSQSGGYAISIKFKSEIKNIKINTASMNESKKFYIDENLKFDTVKELIFHYIENSLVDIYPELPTSLGIPFRSALPTVIETRKAKIDYHPVMNTELEIQKDHVYSIINKNDDMWKVFNSDGLIAFAPHTCF